MKRLLCSAFLSFACAAHAHHGLDFLLVQDAAPSVPWAGMVYANAEWSQTDSINVVETEAGLHLGITSWMSVGVSNAFEGEEDQWDWSNSAPYVSLSLFQSEAIPWLRVGLHAGYSFAEEAGPTTVTVMTPFTVPASSVTSSDVVVATPVSSTSSSSKSKSKSASSTGAGKAIKHTSGGGGGSGPDAPGGGAAHDHPVAATSAGTAATQQEQTVTVLKPVEVQVPPVRHRGIHRHGEEGLTARLIIEAALGHHDKLIFNLINFTPRYGYTGWGYAAGWRHEFNHDFATSVEAIGDYESTGYQQAVVAAHWSPWHSMTFKLGLGAGLSDETPDFSVVTGLVYRF